MEIYERLVAIREKNGYTRKRLADELGRPYATITKYETGEREPGHSYIVEIAKKFGCTTDYLLGVGGTKENAPSQEDEALVDMFYKLNEEGREKLLDYAADLVASGRYIKNNQIGMGSKEA